MMLTQDWRYKLAHMPDKLYLALSKFYKLLLFTTRTILQAWQNKFNIYDNNALWRKVRKLTWPLHHIWIGIYKDLKRKDEELFDLIDETEGLQIIGGNTGSGKTTLANDVIEKSLRLNNKPWYINMEFEKPRYSEKHKALVRYHRFMPFEDVWSDWRMHIRLNQYIYGGYVIDEIHRIFDYRQNQTSDYMSKFVPFRDYAVLIRKHIKKIIGITQMDRLDIQLMHLVKLWHKPRIDIGFDYEDWMLETGLFRFKIKGWYIDTYTVNTANYGDMLVPVKSWYRKATANFDYFDTYAGNDAYNHVPMDQGVK